MKKIIPEGVLMTLLPAVCAWVAELASSSGDCGDKTEVHGGHNGSRVDHFKEKTQVLVNDFWRQRLSGCIDSRIPDPRTNSRVDWRGARVVEWA